MTDMHLKLQMIEEAINQLTVVIVLENTNQMSQEMTETEEMTEVQDITEITEIQDIPEMTEIPEMVEIENKQL